MTRDALENFKQMIKSLLIVTNPYSGSGRALRVANSFVNECQAQDIRTALIEIAGIDQMLIAVTAEIQSKKHQGLVVVGGDGLLHALLPLLRSSGMPFTVIAGGTGNDFARSINTFRRKNGEIIDHIKNTQPRQLDAMSIIHHDEVTIAGQVVSLGFDALVNERANRISYLSGKSKYVIAMLQVLAVFKAMKFTITIDGKRIERDAMLVAIANGPNYGGGMKIHPRANHEDGLLNLVILNKVSLFTLITVFPRVYNGSHLSHRAVELLEGREISIDADAKAFADGEYIDSLPVTAKVEPGALMVWKL